MRATPTFRTASRPALALLFVLAVALPAVATSLQWNTNTNGDWSTAGNWDPPQVPAPGDDVTIDRANAYPTVTLSSANAQVNNLVLAEHLKITSGGSLEATTLAGGNGAKITAADAGSGFTATTAATIDGMSLEALAGGAIDLHAASSYTTTESRSWKATGAKAAQPPVPGTRIDLSGLTSVTGPSQAVRFLTIKATDGGAIDLSGLNALDDGNFALEARGTDGQGTASLIDVSNVTTFYDAGLFWNDDSQATAKDGGEIRFSTSSPLHFTRWHLTIDGASSVMDLHQLTSLTEGSLNLVGSGLVRTLSSDTSLTSLDNNSFSATAGAKLHLDVGSSYTANQSESIAAIGAAVAQPPVPGTLVDASGWTQLSGPTGIAKLLTLKATDGALLDLSGVQTLANGNYQIRAVGNDNGTPAIVDVSGVTDFVDTVGSQVDRSSIRVEDGGQVVLRNGAADSLRFDGWDLTIVGTGSALDLTRVTSMTNSSLTLSGAGLTRTLSTDTALGTLDDNSFYARDGATLALDVGTTYTALAARRIEADGANAGTALVDASGWSALTGPSLAATYLTVSAKAGGALDLSGVQTTSGKLQASADGAGSTVDFTSLTNAADQSGAGGVSSITARNGGVVHLAPQGTTTIENMQLQVLDGGTITGDTVHVLGGQVVRGNSVYGVNLMINEAVLNPGSATSKTAALTFTGDLQQTSLGTFHVDITGAGSTDFDTVDVTGVATLAGALEVRLWNGYTPSAGDFWDVLTAQQIVDDGLAVTTLFPVPGFAYYTNVVRDTATGRDVLRLYVDVEGAQAGAVPEPGTLGLAALLALVLLTRAVSAGARG